MGDMHHPPADTILSARGLTMCYGAPDGALALDGLSFDVAAGEIIALLGPNGAGKTTLLSILCGLLRPTAGEALVGGHRVSQEPMAVKRLIGMVPERVALYPRLSGRRNLRFFGSLYGIARGALHEAVEGALEAVGLPDRGDDPVGAYSLGMKRRLNLAAGLLHTPRLLLLDEPTLGLDPANRRRVLDVIARQRAEHATTVLLATHHMEAAQTLSDRVAILHRGRLVALDRPTALIRAQGGLDRLHLTLEGAPIPPVARQALARMAAGAPIAERDGGLILSTPDAAAALPAILALLEKAGLGVQAVEIQRPNLESAYERLTSSTLNATPGQQGGP